MLSRRRYSRQSKSRSNRPRPVLKRRSSGRAHTSQRFPKRRTYKGTDTHLRGSKQLRFRPNDVEPVYGIATAAAMGTLEITGVGMAVIVISCLLITMIGKLEEYSKHLEDFNKIKDIKNQLQSLWDKIHVDPETKGRVWRWMEWILTEYSDMTPDTNLTEDQLIKILTHGESELSAHDVNALVGDFTDRPLKVFLYCMLTGEDVKNVLQLLEPPTPVVGG